MLCFSMVFGARWRRSNCVKKQVCPLVSSLRWVWSSFPWSYQRDPLSRGGLAVFLEDVDACKDNLEVEISFMECVWLRSFWRASLIEILVLTVDQNLFDARSWWFHKSNFRLNLFVSPQKQSWAADRRSKIDSKSKRRLMQKQICKSKLEPPIKDRFKIKAW